MKKKLSLLVCIVLITSLVVACAQATTTPTTTAPTTTKTTTPTTTAPTTPAAKEHHVFDFTHWVVGHTMPWVEPGGFLQRRLYERSEGQIELNIVEKMFPIMDLLEAVTSGRVDMASVWITYYAGTYPLWDWPALPGLFSSNPVEFIKQEIAVENDPRIMEIYEKTYREIGAEPLWRITTEPVSLLWTSKEVNSIDSLKGLKIRISGNTGIVSLKALGAAAVTVEAAEVTSSLMTGVVDGVMTNFESGTSYWDLTFCKYAVSLPIGGGWANVVLMNRDLYDSLSPDLQKVLKDTCAELNREHAAYLLARFDLNKWKADKAGVKAVYLPKEEWEKGKELLQPVIGDWLKTAGPYAADLLNIVREDIAAYDAFNPYPKK